MAISKLTGKSLDLGTDAIESFASTGIDDNATSTTLTINADGSIVVSDKVQVGGSTGNAYKIYANSNESNQIIGVFNQSAQDSGYITLSANGTTDFARVRLGANADDMVLFAGGTERMRIDSSGRVGIGHSSPEAKLAILGSSNDTISETNANLCVEGGGGNGILFGTQATSPYRSYIQSGYVSNLGIATYDLLLNPEGGNVGIGVSDPDALVEIRSAEPTVKISNDVAKTAGEATIGQIEFAQHYGVNSSSSIKGIEIGGSTSYVSGGLTFSTRPSGGSLTERMRILNTGRVYINEGPSTTLGGFGVENVGGMNIYPDAGFVAMNGDTANFPLYVAKTSSATGGYINFATNGTTRGAIVEEGANIGIRFGGTGSSAHTLDDYEEGTWTPVLRTSNLDGSYSIGGINSAKYTKIGNVVYYSFYCTGLTQNTAGTGSMQIAGLPFNSVGGLYSGGLSTYGDTVQTGLGGRQIVQSGNSYLRLLNENTGGDLAATAWSNVSNMIITGMYWTV